MKINAIFYFVLLLLLCAFTSCEKDDGDYPNGDIEGEVEFYLFDAFETVDSSPEIDLSSIVLSEEVLLGYEDLKSYDAREYFFELTDDAREIIEEMEHPVNGMAFAVTANEEVVYTGYFVPSYSSVSLQWIVIDPIFWHLTNRMYVKLGYPGQFDGFDIPDLRNDDRILDIFRRDRKLVE